MVDFNPNPNVEANAGFDVVRPGVYRMRISEITPHTAKSGNSCLRVKLEYADRSQCIKLDETPAANPGALFDSGLVYEPADKQGRLRNFVEACGYSWGSITSTDVLLGAEVDVKVVTDEYKGVLSNKAQRYLPINS